MKLKLSLCQMDIVPGNPDINRDKAICMINEAAEYKPDVIMLPEMWTTAYELEGIKSICDVEGKPSLDIISSRAKSHGINILAGSFANLIDDKVYNSAYVLNRYGDTIGHYNKIHLFRLMKEDKYITAGKQLCVFEINDIKCGLIICYDLRFPELSRRLALEGINILFVPAQWPKAREQHWMTLLTARAIENQIFVVAVNRAGSRADDVFAGCSMVIDPWGEVLFKADYKEQIHNIEIDLNKIEEVRSKINVYKDRVPELYI
ncbi:MAG: carbon-nitrogen family hydrolase [Bacillota bacterium]